MNDYRDDEAGNRNGIVRKPVNPVPANIRDWKRALSAERSLNDQVEDIVVALMKDDPTFKTYLSAIYDEQAVEGSLSADNIMAAQAIRAYASDHGGPYGEVAEQKLATISKSLGVVLRRYHLSRKERRLTVDGKVVPSGNGGDDTI